MAGIPAEVRALSSGMLVMFLVWGRHDDRTAHWAGPMGLTPSDLVDYAHAELDARIPPREVDAAAEKAKGGTP